MELIQKNAVSRSVLDERVGCANGPALVAELRKKGLDIPCKMFPVTDRDGKKTKVGIYWASESDKLKIAELLNGEA
ncbi:hypothetical protein BJI67_02185 [Acidihalobacter aeolianus]|uniref:Uncharacterized protein n=1 Tax=Acidihalobacter aeolianus TaxID=2792603 RepID=A0A1D8K513_9GAMM|nr:hypothetical protein BJI67_02185 [Acidihalobacter aeolianus]